MIDTAVALLVVMVLAAFVVGAILGSAIVLRCVRVNDERPTAASQLRESWKAVTDAFTTTQQNLSTTYLANNEVLRRRAEIAEQQAAQYKIIAETLAAKANAQVPPPARPHTNGTRTERIVPQEDEAIAPDNVDGEGTPLGRLR